jgi:hypothetical protein
MAIKLLPASVVPPDSSGVAEPSTSIVPYDQRAIATRVNGQGSVAYPDDSYVWSSGGWSDAAGPGAAPRIYGTPVEDSQNEDASDETGRSAWEYVSGSWWGPSIERAATALYSMYSGMLTAGSGQLINVYA